MTNTQMIFALLLPTLAAICSFATALVGISVNNGRFNTMDARLLHLDSGLSDVRNELAKLKGQLGEK